MDVKVWKNGFLVDAKAEIVCDTMIVTPVGGAIILSCRMGGDAEGFERNKKEKQ